MAASLHLFVCQYYLRETRAALDSEGYGDVFASSFPDLCVHPQAARMAVVEQVFAQPPPEGCTVLLVGACFLANRPPLPEDDQHRIHHVALCFHMFLPRSLADEHLRQGDYLVTPGWLLHWRHHIDTWKFDQPTARAFFAETTRRLVLLDTGVDPAAPGHLAACASFLDLPAAVVPAGLDHYRLFLRNLVQEWRAGVARREAEAASRRLHRRLADHGAALDLLVKLSRFMTEDEAIRGIQELFTMLFGATAVRFAPAEDGPPPWPAAAGDGDGYAVTETGFCMRLAQQRETLGYLSVEIPGFHQHRDDYLNLALNIVSLCALALANARAQTQRQLALAALQAKTEELARSNADLEQFAYVAAHDLQAPLRRIAAFSDQLRNDLGANLPAAAQEDVNFIQRSIANMKRLITGLLAYSRVSTSQAPFTAVALDSVMQQVLADLAPRLSETGGEVAAEALPAVRADALQMYQLLLNLVGNALKFVAPGTAPRVRVTSRRAGDGRIELSVCDNGIGFDEAQQASLFKMFHRLHSEAKYPGSGIGLAVCQRIVQRHGGAITAHSRPGEAAFTFTLPPADA